MKKLLSICISLMLVFLSFSSAIAEIKNLPSINEVLRSDMSKKTEVSDNLDNYNPFNGNFDDVSSDVRILILQREAPQKEFTAKKVYPPFTSNDGFPDDYAGIDIGTSKLWVRCDLMQQLPSYFRASSLEDATYLLIGETTYMLDGSISVSDYKNNSETDLPEFKDTDEMIQYFMDHPKVVESITYYPKFGALSLISFYEVETKKCSWENLTYNKSTRFARNPEASDCWSNMTQVADLLDALNNDSFSESASLIEQIQSAEIIPEEKIKFWSSCIDAKEFKAAKTSVDDYYWSMAEELRSFDPSAEHRENYNLIIQERNRDAMTLFVNFCEYSGFDRSVSSIQLSKDYIATPDNDWIEEQLRATVAIFGN